MDTKRQELLKCSVKVKLDENPIKIQFTTIAHKEFLEAIEYYNSLREGLEYEFSMKVDDGIQKNEQFTYSSLSC